MDSPAKGATVRSRSQLTPARAPKSIRATLYKTCIYCYTRLGTNAVLERFPVGRRLAFDSQRGRLWVICERCRRWNLSPLDERWEALEDCDRQFRDTRLRFSTDNIGLARLREGTELVRIGRPLRPEFAAWRYGRQFLRRRVRRLLKATVQGVGYTLTSLVGMLFFYLTDENSRIVARVHAADGRRLPIVRKDLKELEIEPAESPEGWKLCVPYRPAERRPFLGRPRGTGERCIVELEGSAAVRATGQILPRINSFGGSKPEVEQAVGMIEQVGDPARLFAAAPRLAGQTRLTRMAAKTRLALEMAAHEESERRAMQGELRALEAAWREAEEIAAIADRLLIPESIEDWIRRHRSRRL